MNASAEWSDNRPCDRFDPSFKKAAYATLSIGFALLALTSFFYLRWLGDSITASLVFAALWGPGLGAVTFLLLHRMEARMPVAVAFLPERIVWRTRSGKTMHAPYADIREVVASKWKGDLTDGFCNRYAVSFGGTLRGFRLGIWLTAENRTKLEQARRSNAASRLPVP